MSKEKEEIVQALKNVNDTITMVKQISKLLVSHEFDGIEDYAREFKELYGKYDYYKKVQNAIIEETEMLGMDPDYVTKAFDEA